MTTKIAWWEVTIDVAGKTYRGMYSIEDGCVSVRWNDLQTATQLGGHAGYPEQLARRLLRELVAGAA